MKDSKLEIEKEIESAATMNINSRISEKLSCKIHMNTGLIVDKLSNRLYCYLCSTEDEERDSKGDYTIKTITKKQINLQINSIKNNVIEDSRTQEELNNRVSRSLSLEFRSSSLSNKNYCTKHPSDEIVFYCEDCNEEICKKCIFKHKSHKYAPPEIIAKNFESTINNILSSLIELKKGTELNLENVKPVQEFYKGIKDFIDVELKSNTDKVNKIINDRSNFYYSENNKLFKGMDVEVEETIQILEEYMKRIQSANQRILKFGSDLSKIVNNNSEVCLFKKNNSKELLEIDYLVSEAENYINEKFKKVKSKADETMTNFEERCKNFLETIKKFEENVVSSLNSGISSICYRIRRFKQFYSYEIAKFFRNSSLCLMVNKTITLSGLGICGLFVDNLYKKVPSMPLLLEITESYFVTSNPTSSEKETSKKMRETQTEIKTVVVSKEIDLPAIRNIIDPVYLVYFDKSIILHKDRIYYLTLKNLGKEDFIKIWSGSIQDEVFNEKDKSKEQDSVNNQSIVCNDSYVKFNMIPAFGYESDFNEFTMGLICDFIFSYSG